MSNALCPCSTSTGSLRSVLCALCNLLCALFSTLVGSFGGFSFVVCVHLCVSDFVEDGREQRLRLV